MRNTVGILSSVAIVVLSSAANAHSPRVECKKLTADNVVCRGVFADGEVARNMTIQLIDETDKVLATAKTDVKGEYAFKAPGSEYNVVVQGNKGHVASMSSEDIW